MKRFGLLMLGGLVLAACSSASPVRQFTKGDELAYYDFSAAGTFEEGTYADGAVRLQIKDGKYDITLLEGDNELWYGQWGEAQRDVVIDVDAIQSTESQNTVYGVMCRVRGTVGQTVESDTTLQALAAENSDSTPLIASADATEESTAEATAEATVEATDEATAEAPAEATVEATDEATAEPTEEPTAEATDEASTESDSATLLTANNGDGYLFLIEGNGRFAIMRSRGRGITPLVNWTDSSVIKTGPAENRIRAVCVGDYLAMYVNGTFVGDATDDTYSVGQVGLVGSAASRLGLQVNFDNLTVSAANPG
ncbi:MAG: hypothetical protein K8I30_03380 [Anaerolineae bacterium]|nr:hypothetical protein [Anaerolineae bacterium]